MPKKRFADILVAALALLAFGAPACATEELGDKGSVWIVDEMVRLAPHAPAGTATSIRIEAARGEYLAVQPVVRAKEALGNVRVTASALEGAGKIAADNIEVYRESFVDLPTSTPHSGTSKPLPPGTYPDGLIPTRNPADGSPISVGAPLRAQNYTLPAGKTQPYWVDVFVPRTAAPGNYAGTITVETDQGTAVLKLDLQVWAFTLPVTPSLKSSFGMWANSHGQQDYIELMKHRLMPIAPPPHGADLVRMGMSVNNLGFFAQAEQPPCTMSAPPSRETLESARNARASGVALYNMTADEIGQCKKLKARVREWGEALRSVGVKQLITMPPRSDLMDSVDIWVMLPVQFVDSPPDVAAIKAKGGEVWSYTAVNQDDYSPKWQIDFSPMNHRIYGFINQSVGATGLLYWTVDYWSKDPWADPYSYEGRYPGDGFLVYPGANVGLSTIVPAMRLKYIRAAVQDYEYVELLSKAGRRDWAVETIRPIARDWKRWSDDPEQLRKVRHQLALELERVSADKPVASPSQDDHDKPETRDHREAEKKAD